MGWDRELDALENALRNLNAQYDAFLYGSSPKPPSDARRRLGQHIRRLSREDADSAADRFRFSTLLGRYNAFCERWDRLQLEKEAGRRPGVYGHFVRLQTSGPERPLARPNDRVSFSVEEEDTPAAPDPERDLYRRYIEARRARGEDVTSLDFGGFAERLARERKRLKEHFGETEIEFDVVERDGRIRLVAREKNESGVGKDGR